MTLRAVCLILFLSFPLFSEIRNIRFDHLNVDNGLSQGSVYAILQDNRGFMWFGTKDGLNRYDGYHFTIYRHMLGNQNSLSHNHVLSLLEDKERFLWIGTKGGGLCRFNPRSNRFKVFRPEQNKEIIMKGQIVHALFEDQQGYIWIGSQDYGLSRLDPKTECFAKIDLTDEDGKAVKTVFVIKESARYGKDNLWLGCATGLILYNKHLKSQKHFTFKELPNFQVSKNLAVHDILETRKNGIFLATFGAGLIRYDPINNDSTQFFYSRERTARTFYSGFRTGACRDNQGNIWFGSVSDGIKIFDQKKGQFRSIRASEDQNKKHLISDKILSIYRSRSGIIWVGTNGNGISYYYPDSADFSILSKKNRSLRFSSTREICEDQDGDLWISGYGGINILDGMTRRFKAEIFIGESICSLLHDPDDPDLLWVGTEGDGIAFYNKKTGKKWDLGFTYQKGENKILGYSIYTIIYDRPGYYWIGSELGLNKYDRQEKKITHYTHEANRVNSLGSGPVRALMKDSRGELWVGTSTGGISKQVHRSNHFINYVHDHEDNRTISSNTILTFYEDKKGRLWIGTAGGLNRYVRNSECFKSHTMRDGLPNDTIYGILEDNQGHLWLSTNLGISRFNPETGVFKNYDAGYGLQSNEFNRHSSYRSHTNILYFGGVNGISYFDPTDIKENHYKPPLVLTQFKKFNRQVNLDPDISFTSEIQLNYNDSIFSFEFAALNYYNSMKNQYAYKIEELNGEWIHLGNRRDISIANLRPGSYTLKIKGANNNGVWSKKNVTLKLYVRPPFWDSTWFKFLSIVIFIGIIGGFAYWRIDALRKRNIFLSQRIIERRNTIRAMAITLNHEINQPLTILQGNIELFVKSLKSKDITEKQKRYIDKMEKSVDRIADILKKFNDFRETEIEAYLEDKSMIIFK